MTLPRPHSPAASPPARHLCVVLHDVAPARWAGCTQVLREVHAVQREAGVAALPLTLLVVPRLHGDPSVPPLYLRWLRSQARAGHQLALHGLSHRDEGPPPRSGLERLLRERYTAREGEFAALSQPAAAQRLAQGRRWAEAMGLPIDGFVPPAWLASRGARRAIVAAGFTHTCTLRSVQPLPEGPRRDAPALVFSTRSAWRRTLSRWWNRPLFALTRRAPLLRLELHPDDAAHDDVRHCWQDLLARALATRTPITLAQAAAGAARAGTPGALARA